MRQLEVTKVGAGWEIARRENEGFFPMDHRKSRAAAIRYAKELRDTSFHGVAILVQITD